MATVTTDNAHYAAIAEAIKSKSGGTDTYKPEQMAAAIEGIPSTGESEIVPFIENTLTTFSSAKLTEISNYGFAGKTNLQSLYIPNVVRIGGYTFEGCNSLTEICFEKRVTIGTENGKHFFFRGATKAGKIEFKDGFSFYGSSTFAFYSLTKLEAIIIRGDNISKLNTTANFGGSSIEKGMGYIYVPSALLEQYKSETNWVTFADQFRAIEDYPEITGGTA